MGVEVGDGNAMVAQVRRGYIIQRAMGSSRFVFIR